MTRRHLLLLTAITAISAVAVAGTAAPVFAQNQEWEESTPYYEDDAWYDVSEWLDSNDYNPVDEAVGRIDSEEYRGLEGAEYDNDYWDADYSYDDYYYDDDLYDDYTLGGDIGYDAYDDVDLYDYGYDYDDDWYGYDDTYGDDDWFYDYYDNGYARYSDYDDDGIYDYSYRYYDYDGDNNYDSYVTSYDWDDDGVYEDVDYYSLNDAAEGKQKATKEQTGRRSRQQTVSGQIVKMKRTSVGDTKHLVVGVKRENEDHQHVIADLGPVNELYAFDLDLGDRVSMRGPMARIGQKPVLMANWIKSSYDTARIDRSQRSVTGTIKKLKKIDVRGSKHVLAILETQGGHQRLVDLGMTTDSTGKLAEGDKVTVSGPRAKMNDRQVIMASQFEMGGDTHEVDRRKQQSSRKQQAAGDRQAKSRK